MERTYDDAEHNIEIKSASVSARVTATFYEAFAAKAAQVPGRSVSEYAREVLERAVFEEPAYVTLLAELLAFRRLFVRSFLVPEADMTIAENAMRLVAQTDAAKLERARVRLGLTQPVEGAQP